MKRIEVTIPDCSQAIEEGVDKDGNAFRNVDKHVLVLKVLAPRAITATTLSEIAHASGAEEVIIERLDAQEAQEPEA